MPRSHRHNDVELNFIEDGAITYRFAATHLTIRAGQLALFWGALPHQLVHATPSTSMYWLTIPLAMFLHWQLPVALTGPVLDGRLIGTGDTTYMQLDRALFAQWHADLAADHAECRAIVTLELEARIRRLALAGVPFVLPGAAPDDGGIVDSSRRRAEQMAKFIAEHYAEPLCAEQIAQAAHLHPNYAMQLFRHTFGLRLSDYVTLHRVAHAQRLLVTSDASILDIALAVGFGSTSRFYVAFKQICGRAPGAYRAALRGA